MSDREDTEDYKVGYGKPPKNGQFRKGVSGNPSGRPKKALDLISVLMRELNSKAIVNDNGRRKSIKKLVVMMRQLANKAATGDPKATRMVLDYGLQAQEKVAEQQQNSLNKPNYEKLKPEDLTDEDLSLVIQGKHPKYSDNRKLDNRSSSQK